MRKNIKGGIYKATTAVVAGAMLMGNSPVSIVMAAEDTKEDEQDADTTKEQIDKSEDKNKVSVQADAGEIGDSAVDIDPDVSSIVVRVDLNYNKIVDDVIYSNKSSKCTVSFDMSGLELPEGYTVSKVSLNESSMEVSGNIAHTSLSEDADLSSELLNGKISIEYTDGTTPVNKDYTLQDFNIPNEDLEKLSYKWVIHKGDELSWKSIQVDDKSTEYHRNIDTSDNNIKLISHTTGDDYVLSLNALVPEDDYIEYVKARISDGKIIKNSDGTDYINIPISSRNGDVEVNITAKDYCGNVITKSIKIHYLNESIDIYGIKNDSNYSGKVVGNTIYFRDKLKYSFINWDLFSKKDIRNIPFTIQDSVSTVSGLQLDKDGSFVIDKSVTILKGSGCDIYKLSNGTLAINVIKDEVNPTITSNIYYNGDTSDKESVESGKSPSKVLSDSDTAEVIVNDDNLIDSIQVSVNGSKIYSSSKIYNKKKTISASFDKNGNIIIAGKKISCNADSEYNIVVMAVDVAGNSYNYYTTVTLDYTAPIVSSGTIVGGYGVYDNKVYIQDDAKITGIKAEDDLNDVESLKLAYKNPKTGKVIEIKDLTKETEFSLTTDGEYIVVATDTAGNRREVSLESLLGISDATSFVIDKDAPVIDLSSKSKKIMDSRIEYNGVRYITNPCDIEYMISDSNLKSFDIGILESPSEGVKSLVKDDSVVLNILKDCNGPIKYVIRGEDKSSRVTSHTYTLHVDTGIPVIDNVEVNGEYKEFGGKLYFKSKPTVNVTAHDDGSGIKSYKIGDTTNTTGVFTVGTGTYSLEVLDNVGHSSGVKKLEECSTLPSSNIVVDSESPTINTSRPSGDVNGWYAKCPMYSVRLKDNVGIKSAKVEINGKSISSYSAKSGSSIEDNILLSGDTSKVNAENGKYEVKVYVEDLAGNTNTWSDIIYVDDTCPTIDKVVFTGTGYQDGITSNSKGMYGFYFKGDGHCEVNVSDGKISSGLRYLYVEQIQNGKSTIKKVAITGGSAEFDIPKNFKGEIRLYADDRVGNNSKTVKPDKVINGTPEFVKNHIGVSINLPSTRSKDVNGNPLYNKDAKITSTIKADFNGIRTIEWSIGSRKGKISVDNNGKVTGDTGEVTKKDNNLIVDMSKYVSSSDNVNGVKVSVKVTDRAGYVSESTKTISIDKDAPVISVTYNQSNESGYYNSNRTATIRVNERNFDPSKVVISGNIGTLGGWSKGNDGEWYNTITFSTDGDYEFSVRCIDLAGNVSNVYNCPKFTIDKTSPVVAVTFDNNNASNGNYYKASRTATVTVTEHNFNPSNITVTGATISGWSNNGDTHTASIVFDKNGTYKFSISGSDMAGNSLNNYSSEEFVIDLENPVIEITGVEKGVSYKKDIGISVKVSDDAVDIEKSSVILKGKRNGEIDLEGSIGVSGGTLVLNNLPNEEKYDDVYTLNVVVIDKAGNKEEKQVTFSVNRFGSAYSIENEDILGNYINVAKDISFSEYNVDEIDLSKVDVVVLRNGTEIDVDKDLVAKKDNGEKDGKHVYKYTVNKEVFTEDGKYLIQIYSSSKDGTKYNSVSQEYSFVLDTTAPDLIVSGIESNGKYRGYTKNVTLDIKDMSGIKSKNVLLNGKEVSVNEKDGLYKLDIPESNKYQKLEITVIDNAGNENTATYNDFLVTSSFWLWLINQFWFKVSGIGLLALIALISGFVVGKKRKKSSATEEDVEETEEDL